METESSAKRTLERPTDSRLIIIPHGLDNGALLNWAQRKIIGFANTCAIRPKHRTFTFALRNFLATQENAESLEYEYIQRQALRYEQKVAEFIATNRLKVNQEKRGRFIRWATATAVISMYSDLIDKQPFSPVFSDSRNVLARRLILKGAKLSNTEEDKELDPDWVNAMAIKMWESQKYSTDSRNLLETFANEPQYTKTPE